MRERNFLHVLLFQCPQCDEPIATVKSTMHRSLEKIDASEMELTCNCLWTGKILGMEAKRHIVLNWDGTAATRNPTTTSRYDESATLC
jgi:hypothetical protein